MIINLTTNFATNHCTNSLFGIESWNKYLDRAGLYDNSCNLTSTFTVTDHGWLIAAGILDILVRVAGFVAVIFVISGGYKYIISQGSPDKTSSALRTIINALVGLAISMIATVTVSFIAGSITESTSFNQSNAGQAALSPIFTIVYGIAGAIAALMVVIGGFKFVTSTGDPQKVSSARNTIVYSLVGLMVVILAATITSFVAGRI